MKKFSIALLAMTAVSASVVMADAPVASATGFYLGAGGGVASTNTQYSYSNNNNFQTYRSGSAATPTAIPSASQQNTKIDGSKTAALFGMFAGYGMQMNQMYFGGELYAGFDTTKVTPMDDSATGNQAGYWKTTVTRKNYYGFAPRIGYFVTPSTMVYARFGIELGKWNVKVDPDMGTINWDWRGAGSITPAALKLMQDGSSKAFQKSKNAVSFAPGLGFEMYMTKNVFMRAEYSYLFGPSISVDQNIDGYPNTTFYGTGVTHKVKIRQHAVKVGVGYKF